MPFAVLGAVAVAAIAVVYRPLLLASALPEVADAGASAPAGWSCAS